MLHVQLDFLACVVLSISLGRRITTGSSLQQRSLQAAPTWYQTLPLSRAAATNFHVNILLLASRNDGVVLL